MTKCKNVCPEWLRWGLGNCEHVGKAHCIKTLNYYYYYYYATHLSDKCSNADWHSLDSQVILPVIFSKQLLVQSKELGRSFTARADFVQKTALTYQY